jgi:alkylresorcinol/alkylpyrone synthase
VFSSAPNSLDAVESGGRQDKILHASVKLLGLATATPSHIIRQTDAAAAASKAFAGRFDGFDRMAQVFETTGIVERHLVRSIEWYLEPKGWPERGVAYLEAASALYIEAAGKALAAAGVRPEEVDSVVTASSTGIATPSLDARVSRSMGFRADIERVPLFGLGCAGGVSGLSIARRLAEARPGAVVLFVAVELCSLSFRLDELTKANIVASALFADGAAACVLRQTEGRGEGEIAEFEASGEHLWPGTLDIMGWKIDPQGLGVIFDRAIPPFAQRHVGPAVNAILSRAGLCLADVDRFICHPGGTKVIIALEESLALVSGTLDHERAILASYGNMSAPTVLFVLEQAIKAGLPPRSALLAMGPGFTASCLTLCSA